MAKTTRQYIFDGWECLREPLKHFVESQFEAKLSGHWQQEVKNRYANLTVENGVIKWDRLSLLRAMDVFWNDVFRSIFGGTERSLVNELIAVRNRDAHDEKFTYNDAERALDSMSRLMDAISAGDAAGKIRAMRNQILKTRMDEESRNEERRKPQQEMEGIAIPGLKPWRDVVEPHPDVLKSVGAAEFAANLSAVHQGIAPEEYQDPEAFFARTFLTDGLRRLLEGAVQRLSGKDGNPIVELQTNFGGGKTHSLLALYHLASGTDPHTLPGVDQIKGINKMPREIKRAVLVGTQHGPSDEIANEDGLKINTSWGSMAWQIGGREGYNLVKKQDEDGMAPGSEVLCALFEKAGPCLILIDEWVVYLRQLYGVSKHSTAGTFESNISFVHALTEAVKISPKALLVATLPESENEFGGDAGKESLDQLKKTFRRMHTPWNAATQEESYEIVRRRLFNDVSGGNLSSRESVIKKFHRMYRDDEGSFPNECSSPDYLKKLELSYPIHPELFDQLYETWSTIDNFQLTRGILRLMAWVVHTLWHGDNKSPLIMPADVPLSIPEVGGELAGYLEGHWPNIIESDIDGNNATPRKIDIDQKILGKARATQRVARALFIGTAPHTTTAGKDESQNPGIDIKNINLAVVQPSEKPVTFNDALNRLANQATHLHSDRGRYWYARRQNINKLADDIATQYDHESILNMIDKDLSKYVHDQNLGKPGRRKVFTDVCVAPKVASDVYDRNSGICLVVLGVRVGHKQGETESTAMKHVMAFTHQCGNATRVNKNTLIFLAPDSDKIDSLAKERRSSLAWKQIVDDKGKHDLPLSDLAGAEEKKAYTEKIYNTKMHDAWQWLIYPYQEAADKDPSYIATKVNTREELLLGIQKKLEADSVIYPKIGPETLNLKLEDFIWQEKPHIKISDLLDYHERHIYMPRLVERGVLIETIRTAIGEMIPGQFAYAARYDEDSDTYKGLVIDNGPATPIDLNEGFIVRPKIAEAHRPQPRPGDDRPPADTPGTPGTAGAGTGATGGLFPGEGGEGGASGTPPAPPAPPPLATIFKGSVTLSADRPARDMERIIEGIVEQLTSIEGAEVELTLEIHADVPSGIDNSKRRTLLENANTLGFKEKDVR